MLFRSAVRYSDLVFVCVGTPSQPNGGIDLRYVRRVCEQIGRTLASHAGAPVIVMRSTMLPGTMREVVIPLLEKAGLNAVDVQNPLTSFAEEVAATKRAIALQDGPVILVGHSWGGVVIGEAGADPKVVGLVYVA